MVSKIKKCINIERCLKNLYFISYIYSPSAQLLKILINPGFKIAVPLQMEKPFYPLHKIKSLLMRRRGITAV